MSAYKGRGCDVCGSQWVHRVSIHALMLMGGKSPRWPKRKQAIFECFECRHRMLVMQGVSRDVLEFRI